MNQTHSEVESNHVPYDREARRAGPAGNAAGKDFVRRAMAAASSLQGRLDVQLKEHPYATVGLACLAGGVVGVALSSRILVAALRAAAITAALELTKSYVRSTVLRPQPS